MRTIKIQSKNLNTPGSTKQPNEQQSTYKQLINSSPDSTLKQKLGGLLGELCQYLQNKTNLKLKLIQQLKEWLKNNKNIQIDLVVSQFRIYLFQAINFVLKKEQDGQKCNTQGQKLIRIKSQERIKLRLIKQNESTGQIWQTEQQKQQQNKQKIIYQLKNTNKDLQRKIVLLSTQFNKLKKMYQVKIEKYKKLLNTSLLNFQIQLDKQMDNQNNLQFYDQYIRTNNLNGVPVRDRDMVTKYQEKQLYRKQSFGAKLTTQQSHKPFTISSLPILQNDKKLSNRQYSQKYFGNL